MRSQGQGMDFKHPHSALMVRSSTTTDLLEYGDETTLALSAENFEA